MKHVQSKSITKSPLSKVLWLPSPALYKHIDLIEKSLLEDHPEKIRPGECSNPPPFFALDLACGSGRDCVFLALRGLWQVVGIDYLEKQLEKARCIAKANSFVVNVHDRIEYCNWDIEASTERLFHLPTNELQQMRKEAGKEGELYDLVNVARYLHRPLLPIIPQLIRKGGFICFHTFVVGCEKSKVGRPKKPRFLLKHDELASIFSPQNGWTIMVDDILPIRDGRPTSFFIARRNK
eukprot:TRINITY_DN6319_c0_g2_i1.p1 TRINITY_DN6319_c0_g2~~TRINITY_DN6319_c0_g2_i1.p1  ORF type:complete len:245 (+),score=32.60 TRINITY_DN6319_c0_g2_i1:25-735(+)